MLPAGNGYTSFSAGRQQLHRFSGGHLQTHLRTADYPRFQQNRYLRFPDTF